MNQVIAAAAPGDAITGQAFAWQRLLAGWGHAGAIVAENVHPTLARRVGRLDGGGAGTLEEGAVILHYSLWSATIDAALDAPGPLAVCYHNITPGYLLRDANSPLADACDRGRAALPGLRGRTTALIADSAFNAAELGEIGLSATVVPLLLDLPARPAERAPRAAADPPTILSVGRIAPNKRLEDVIKAFALFQRHHSPDASLVLLGSESSFERYRDALVRLIERIGVRGVRMTGHVSDDERDRIYAGADAYLCMSVHEGFCAPLVEAMARGIPVVARRAGAVPETLGGAGIVLEGELPLFAEALHEVVASEATRRALRAAGRRRLVELGPEPVAGRLREALAPILDTP